MKQLLQALLDRLNLIPGLNYVGIFNNQLQSNKGDNVFFPAVYVEVYGGVEYESGLGDVQYGTCKLRFHIINNSPLQGEEMDIYTLKTKVNEYLQHYTNGEFQPLVRVGEETDNNHTNLYIYKIDYQTRFAEVVYLDEDYDTISIDEVVIDYDMNDDGDEIKTDTIGERFIVQPPHVTDEY